ncbi:MAG: putative Ig domain-containing protein [Burkholderiaceae bacterium]
MPNAASCRPNWPKALLSRLARVSGGAAALATTLLLLVSSPQAQAQSQVSQGQTIYQAANGHGLSYDPGSCASCHFANAAPNQTQTDGTGSNHILAANNRQRILDAFAAGGVMTNYLGTTALNPSNAAVMDRAFKLALYIGQYRAPVFKSAPSGACTNPSLAMAARSGAASVQDIYPCLADDGSGGAAQDSGGLLISGQVNAPTVTAAQVSGTATVAYNISYTSAAGFTGAASFNVSVVNPAAPGGVSKSVAVTVYGVTSGTSATGVVGATYTAGSPLYTITSNDPSATFSASLVSPSAALSSLGLSVDGSGRVTGTLSGTPGTYTMRVQANISAATVGAANAGAVTRDVTLVVGGITSAAVVNYTQDQAVTPYQITSNLAITPNSYTLANVPPGMSFSTSTGQLSGTPTFQGTTNTTIGAGTSAGPISQSLQINVASAGPPVLTSNLPAAPTAMGTVNSSVNGASYALSATRPPLGNYVLVGANPLPTGLTLNATSGAITGTPSVSGDFPVSFRTSNAAGNSNQLDLTLRVHPNAVPVISSATTVSASANQAFAGYQIVASNPVILGYSVVAPSTLPPGLTLDTSTGLVTGTPTSSGSFATDLRASNAAGDSAPHTVNFTIVPTSVPAVTVPLLASPAVTGTVGSPITPIQISATNPAILSFGATGLPGGLSVNGSGQIVGTPTQSGDFTVTATATNASGTGSAAPVTIRISPSTVPTITSASSVTLNVNAAPGTVYQITATQPVLTAFAVVPPSVLPPGLALNTSSGAITGSPTSSGAFSTLLSASNAAGTSAAFTLAFNIQPVAVPVVTAPLQPAPLVTGTVGTPITPIQINATHPAILSYGATGLPAGLSVNGSGQIVGTPSVSGDFAVSVSATNVVGTGTSAAPVTIRINPNSAPVITSAATASGTTGTAFATYQITASNGPIVSYAVVAPSQLPAGLSLNTSTGQISGTPSASGTVQTRFSASNVSGASAPFTVTFTIDPSDVPVITSPTFAALAAGAPITPIQIAATHPAVLEYTASNLPPGLVLDAVAGTITGTPTTPGSYSVLLGARNVVGTGSLTVPFNVGIPVPTSCTMSVPLNTPTTLDLASCLFAGFAPTGVTILATPAHGTAVASGTRVTYTPVNNYFGTDSFTFVGTGQGGTSPQGTVTVTVTGRPDPMQDPVVARVLSAQTEAAQRFAGAQIANFQRRMESLHRPPGVAGPGGIGLQGPAPAAGGFAAAATGHAITGASQPVVPPQLAPTPAAGGGIDPRTPGGITSLAANHAPAVATESDVINALGAGLGIQSMPLAQSVLSLVRNRSVNLAGVGSGLGLNATTPNATSTNYWIEGVASFGTRDASGTISGSEFSSDGITVGMDRRYSETLALGMGLGYARDKTLIGNDGSVNRSKGYSLAVYGSYQPQPDTYIDAMLGVASLDFTTRRFVAPVNDFAIGRRSGTQWFGSITGGYEYRNGHTLLSPYGRLDFAVDRLGSSTEHGAGAYALTYFSQTNTSLQGVLGLRAESIHDTRFGYVVPRLRAEYRHEFRRAGQAFIAYADQVGGARFAQAPAGGPRDSIALGLGSDFILRDGLTLSVEYQLSHSFSNASTHALRLRLSKDFDVRGLPRLTSLDPEAAHDEPINVQLEAGAVYDDNVTRAKAGPDRRGDHAYALNVSKAIAQPLSANSRLLMIGTLGGEKFRRFNGLSRLAATAEAEYQYRASSEFDEPTLGAFARLSAEGFESELRDGYRLSVGLSYRQPLTDRINVFAALSHNQRHASSRVFSTRDNSIRGNIDYTLSDTEIIYLGAEYRKGDIVSTGRASLENVTVADVLVQDDAYPGGQFFSYRFRGSTVLLTAGYNLALGPRDSIDFSWRHIRSTPGLRPSWVTSPRSYTANQLSAVYLMRF